MFEDLVKKEKRTTGIIWDIKGYLKDPKCIDCGSKNIQEEPRGMVNQFFNKKMVCSTCGLKWYVTCNSLVPIR